MDDDEAVKQYIAELSACTPIAEDEESELFRAMLQGQSAEKRLIESKLPLVIPIAERYTSSGMPLLHLIQEGNVGLMTAVRRFPESRRSSFAEYATEMIEKAIQFGVAEYKREAAESKK